MNIFEFPSRNSLLRSLVAASLLLPGLLMAAGEKPKAEGAAREGYLTTEDTVIVTNDYGECWHTPWWRPEHAVAGCDPVVEPAPEAEAATPAAPPSTLVERVFFEFDRAVLDNTDRMAINGVLDAVPEGRSIGQILLSGHADRIGTDEYNLRLSERRALSVKGYLEQTRGIAAGLIGIRALGESEPEIECADGLGWTALVECLQPDRRVEMAIQLD